MSRGWVGAVSLQMGGQVACLAGAGAAGLLGVPIWFHNRITCSAGTVRFVLRSKLNIRYCFVHFRENLLRVVQLMTMTGSHSLMRVVIFNRPLLKNGIG